MSLKEKEVPALTTYTATATIAEGFRSVTILTNNAFAGTILGTAGVASTTYTYTAHDQNILGEIPVVITAGAFTVLTLK